MKLTLEITPDIDYIKIVCLLGNEILSDEYSFDISENNYVEIVKSDLISKNYSWDEVIIN